MNNSRRKSRTLAAILVCLTFAHASCSHYKEGAGRKTEYNGETGRFETSDYVSVGFSTSPQKKPAPPLTEKDLKKAQEK